MRLVRMAAVLMVLAGGLTAGCSQDEVTETVVRNAAAVLGSAEFERNGHRLEKVLTCTSSMSGQTVTVNCEGNTNDGKPVTMTGDLAADESDNTKLSGSVVGTVDGEEVFRRDCIGAC